MPKTFSNLINTVYLMTILAVNMLYKGIGQGNVPETGAMIGFAAVIAAYVIFVIVMSHKKLITSQNKLISVYGGMILLAVITWIVSMLLSNTDFDSFALLVSILLGFGLAYFVMIYTGEKK